MSSAQYPELSALGIPTDGIMETDQERAESSIDITDPIWQAQAIAAARVQASGIPDKFRGGWDTFSGDWSTSIESDPEAVALKRAAYAWCEGWTPGERGPALIGGVGTGKTHLAACIAIEMASRGYKVKWRNTCRLMRDIRATWGKREGDDEQDLIDDTLNCQIVVLDDLGVERPQLHVLEALYDILNTAIERGITVIITSNYNSKGLTERLSKVDADMAEQFVSRLGGAVKPLGKFPAKDRRRG